MEMHLPERVQNAYLTGRPGLDDQHVSADLIYLSKTSVALCGVLEPYASSAMGDTTRGRRVASWLGSVAAMLRSAGFSVIAHNGWYGPAVLVVADNPAGARSASQDDVRRIVELNA